MRAMTRRSLAGLAAGGATLLAAPRIGRADFSQATTRIMVGFSAGGTVDTIARIVAQAIGPILGESVIVENRPGGSGSIFSHAVAPALVKLNYDTIRDFAAVSQVASVPLLVFASEKSPYHSLADVVTA